MSETKRGRGRALQGKKRTEPGKPTWREYTSAEWYKLLGLPLDLISKESGRFVFNESGVCINPNVLGVVGRGWWISVCTAKDESGRWVSGDDISFSTAGHGCLPLSGDHNNFNDEKEAQLATLRMLGPWVERWADPRLTSCPISGAHATAALRLIREKIDELSAPKLPTYTQLSLW